MFLINEEDATQFMEGFENLRANKKEKQINKINFGRFVKRRDQINFHHRPSFLGEGLEQRQRYAINTKFNRESIYVWNIGGTPEYQVYDILNNMLTFSITYESNDHSNGEVVILLINGFNGRDNDMP